MWWHEGINCNGRLALFTLELMEEKTYHASDHKTTHEYESDFPLISSHCCSEKYKHHGASPHSKHFGLRARHV